MAVGIKLMKKRAYFLDHRGNDWPDFSVWRQYFLSQDQRRFMAGTNEGNLTIEDIDGTDHLESEGRVSVQLVFSCKPNLGVQFMYSRLGRNQGQTYFSKGDLRRLWEFAASDHGASLPVGFFVPFEMGLKVVESFDETNGKLPTCVEWVSEYDIPLTSGQM
jgi:hypothetical protein